MIGEFGRKDWKIGAEFYVILVLGTTDMTLHIEVSGELEVALREQAVRQGLPADRVAHRVLAEVLTPSVKDATAESGEERARAFVQWAKSHRDTPPLSDEAISRASIYADRG